MTDDGTLQLAGVVNRLINQQIFIKSLIYSKLVPSVVEDTSINYRTYLLIYLTNKTTYAKFSNARQNRIHHKRMVIHAVEFHREKTVYSSKEELM